MSNSICLFAKIEAPTYSSVAMVAAFQQLGYQVIDLDWQMYRYQFGIESMREQLRNLVELHRPELIFLHIQNIEVMDAETVVELKRYGAKVVNFSEDVRDPLPEWIIKVGKEAALTVMTNQEDVWQLRELGVKSQFLPTSYNNIWYKPQGKTEKKYGDILFLGNNYINTDQNFEMKQERVDMVNFLRKEFPELFQVYGMGWGPEIMPLNPQEAIEAMCNAKIIISQSNFDRVGYTSDRLFSAIGTGSLVFPKYYEGIREQFVDPIFWKDFKELSFMIKSELIQPGSFELMRHGMQIDVLKNHQWVNRFSQIKQWINE